MNRRLAIVSILLIVFYILGVNTPKAQASVLSFDVPTEISTGIQAGSGVAEVVREYILKPIARVLARGMLSKLSSSIISEIQNGGRGGGPAFVQDWTQFQTQAQRRGENVFLAELKDSYLCGDFSNSIKAAFGVRPTDYKNLGLGNPNDVRTDSLQTYGIRTKCTMPSGFTNQKYQQDFAGNGGWATFSRMLEPQNNYYGVLFASLDEVANQRSLAQNGALHEATAGSGYTSIRAACQDRTLAPGEEGPIQQSSESRCTFMGKVFTPGDLLGKSAASTVDNELGWITSSTEISSLVIDVASAVINRLGNSLGGLATANTASDYANAPSAGDSSELDEYWQCINSCPAGTDANCQMDCAANIPGGGYNVPRSSCTVDANTGEVICHEIQNLCINHDALEILKKPVVYLDSTMADAGEAPISAANLKEFIPKWAAARLSWIGLAGNDSDNDKRYKLLRFNAIMNTNLIPIERARNAISNDRTQLGNDAKLKALQNSIEALAAFVASDANDGLLTYNNRLDTKLIAIYRKYDELVNEPDCSTQPAPLPPGGVKVKPGVIDGGGGSGQTCANVPTAMACLVTTRHYQELVKRVKDYLVAKGTDITGYCGAFEITKRVAWALRDEGVGLLRTIHSSQCNGLAAGNIAYKDNSGADILDDVGGRNTPQWNPGPSQNESGVYYVYPIEQDDEENYY